MFKQKDNQVETWGQMEQKKSKNNSVEKYHHVSEYNKIGWISKSKILTSIHAHNKVNPQHGCVNLQLS